MYIHDGVLREMPEDRPPITRAPDYSLENKDPKYLDMLDTQRCGDCWGQVAVEEIKGSGGVMITCVSDGSGRNHSCMMKWWVADETLD